MGFWQPAKIEEDKQLELDKRVILGIAKEKLKKDLEKVNNKLNKLHEKWDKVDIFSMSKAQRIQRNISFDNTSFEKGEIERRLSLIDEELN